MTARMSVRLMSCSRELSQWSKDRPTGNDNFGCIVVVSWICMQRFSGKGRRFYRFPSEDQILPTQRILGYPRLDPSQHLEKFWEDKQEVGSYNMKPCGLK